MCKNSCAVDCYVNIHSNVKVISFITSYYIISEFIRLSEYRELIFRIHFVLTIIMLCFAYLCRISTHKEQNIHSVCYHKEISCTFVSLGKCVLYRLLLNDVLTSFSCRQVLCHLTSILNKCNVYKWNFYKHFRCRLWTVLSKSRSAQWSYRPKTF